VAGKHTSPSHEKNWTRVLVVLGEKDQDLLSNRSFWKNYYKTNQATYYTEKIINGADHSFFGWQFKTDVKKAVTQWTTGVD
jgi:alpha/beta superfamily hydrolase